MKDKYHYKVKYGFKPLDYVSIEAGDELEKAICAWTTGNVVSVGGKMINGNNIISIEPHFHKYTGWHETYEPRDGEDMKQIERDCPSFDGILPYYRERVVYLTGHDRHSEIGTSAKLPIALPEKIEKPKELREGGFSSIKNILPKRKD